MLVVALVMHCACNIIVPCVQEASLGEHAFAAKNIEQT